MTGIRIGGVEVRTYFPTPVALARVEGSEALNRDLAALILDRERQDVGLQHSNLGGWQSAWDFPEWGGAPGRAVLEAGMALATRLTADRAGRPVKPAWKHNAWANINRQGHANEFHTHPGSYWSGTYYVDDGGIAAEPALGGELELQDPRGVAPAMYAPQLAFAVRGTQSVGASELIRPEAGTLILFPAWLSHGVRPYTGGRTRISIAFNLSL